MIPASSSQPVIAGTSSSPQDTVKKFDAVLISHINQEVSDQHQKQIFIQLNMQQPEVEEEAPDSLHEVN